MKTYFLFLCHFLEKRRLIMERIEKLLSLFEMCSDSEETKKIIKEICQGLEERENGKVKEK